MISDPVFRQATLLMLASRLPPLKDMQPSSETDWWWRTFSELHAIVGSGVSLGARKLCISREVAELKGPASAKELNRD